MHLAGGFFLSLALCAWVGDLGLAQGRWGTFLAEIHFDDREAMIRLTGIDLDRKVTGLAGMQLDVMPTAVFSASLTAAVSGGPPCAEELNEFGRKLFQMRMLELAYVCFELAAKEGPAVGVLANLGRCDIHLGRPDKAVVRARLILSIDAGLAMGWQLLGEALAAQKHYAEAIDALHRAEAIAPDHGLVSWQLGEVYALNGDAESACDAYRKALLYDPRDIQALGSLIYNMRRICDWHELQSLEMALKGYVAKGRGGISPFDFLAEGATAAEEYICASKQAAYVGSKFPRASVHEDFPPFKGIVRVGFVSCGFGPHPLASLTVCLFEHLREAAVEVHLFSTCADAGNSERRRLEAAAHSFHHVPGMPALELASAVRNERIEILFDLDGYSNGRRLEVSAHRPAPIQVSWLGYPGTTGTPFIDYVIADNFVLPAILQPHFSETIAYLRQCYFCTDTKRLIEDSPTREACGLPERPDIVYACFNATFKLNPRSFIRMMRILRDVPSSVLWLLKGEGRSSERLGQVARSWGVNPDRLVFMEKLSNAEYLARYRHVDLFLDTENYGAHTTASDALWANCPVLTRPGDTFATRVAGSLNHHLGMDEMNVHSDDEFVSLGVRYGQDPDLRSATLEKMSRLKDSSALFNMESYANDFSNLLMRMSSHYRAGGIPANLGGARGVESVHG